MLSMPYPGWRNITVGVRLKVGVLVLVVVGGRDGGRTMGFVMIDWVGVRGGGLSDDYKVWCRRRLDVDSENR